MLLLCSKITNDISFLIGGKKKKKGNSLLYFRGPTWSYLCLQSWPLTLTHATPGTAAVFSLFLPLSTQGHCVDLELAIPGPGDLSPATSPRRCSLPCVLSLSPPLSHFIEALCPSSVPWKMQLLPHKSCHSLLLLYFTFKEFFTAWNYMHFQLACLFLFLSLVYEPQEDKTWSRSLM